jgi:hypothetical protein
MSVGVGVKDIGFFTPKVSEEPETVEETPQHGH